MIAAILAAALATSSPTTIAVPFVPQTDALCGGAAAAMVFRYWGDAHADVRQFASLVERRRGGVAGIADDVLVNAVRGKGWRTESAGSSIDALRARIDARQPVIVLLADRRDRYHYVVMIGVSETAVIVHDPSWGPSRAIGLAEFSRLWTASHQWSLVVLPGADLPARAHDNDASNEAAPSSDPCVVLLNRAVQEVRVAGLDKADEILARVRAECPASAGPDRELAGVRFAQHRWHDAARLAKDALQREPADGYAADVLGSSLFMQDDQVGALRAWNRIDKPRLDLVRIEGVHRTRYQSIADAVGLEPGSLLTADAFRRAAHRLGELPDRSSARMTLRPDEDGFASVDVAIVERAGWPRSASSVAGAAVRAGVEREASMSLPGFTGQGELWSASWRWWSNRPAVSVGFTAPRVAGLPGVWSVTGGWSVETYGGNEVATVRETRWHGGASMSDWLTGGVRYAISAGLDRWSDDRRAASLGASLERRWWADRLSASGDVTTWTSIAGGRGFNTAGARATLRSSADPTAHAWLLHATAGADRASVDAPRSLWPGAGEGLARTLLLRAHPLMDEGRIDLGAHTVFGRSVQHASVETVRWLPNPQLTRMGVALFGDAARSTRSAVGDGTVLQTDVGAGLRVRVPGDSRVLRIDFAHGLRDGANAVTVGWMF